MINRYLAYPMLLLCLAAPLVHAENVDLTTFDFFGPNRTSGELSANLAWIPGGTFLANNLVEHVVSFDWSFTNLTATQTSLASFSAPEIQSASFFLASNETLGSNASTGWQTYTFTAPYTGYISFVSTNGVNSTNSFLAVRNLSNSVAAVPEPETYAMLLAGLGLMAGIARRRSRRTGNPSVRNIPAIPNTH